MSNKIRSMEKARQRKQSEAGITVTLNQLVRSAGALGELCGQPLPIVLSYQLSKITKAVNVELTQYNESTKTLSDRYALKDDEGNVIKKDGKGEVITDDSKAAQYMITLDPDKIAEANKELNELGEMEVVIPGEQVKIADIPATVAIAPSLLSLIDWLVVE